MLLISLSDFLVTRFRVGCERRKCSASYGKSAASLIMCLSSLVDLLPVRTVVQRLR
jgi:hypothetical protein